MYNKRLLSKIKMGKLVKPNPYKKDIIVDPMGQWKHPGENTRIPSSSITMKGVNYPVLGVSNTGQKQMMQPGKKYNFPGAKYVDEYPQMAKGGAACPPGKQIYSEFKSQGCLSSSEYARLKTKRDVYINTKKRNARNILDLKAKGQFDEAKIAIGSFKKKYPKDSWACPGGYCPPEVLKLTNEIKNKPPKQTKTPCTNPITNVVNKVPEKIPFGKKLVGTDDITEFAPGKDCEYIRTIYPIYEDIKVEKIDPQPIQLIDQDAPGSIQGTQTDALVPPQYKTTDYEDPRTKISLDRGNQKSINFNLPKYHKNWMQTESSPFHGTKRHSIDYKPIRGIDIYQTEPKTRVIPQIVQKFSGYDPKYMEGYDEEVGDETVHIPGEIEKAEQEGRRINFKGASTLRDLKEQKKYNKEWDTFDENQKLKDYYNKVYSNLPYKTGGSSAQKIIFAPREGGCPDGQYWTGTECKTIPKGTKIVYSQEELDKLNISRKEHQKLYNDYISRKQHHATIDAAKKKKFGPTHYEFYKTLESIPAHGWAPMMSYGPSSLIPDALDKGIPGIEEDMVSFKQYKKMLDKSSVKPIGYRGRPGGGHFYPVYEKPSKYILGYNREEKKIEEVPEPIQPDPLPEQPIKLIDQGPLGSIKGTPLDPLVSPQYIMEDYKADRPDININWSNQKSIDYNLPKYHKNWMQTAAPPFHGTKKHSIEYKLPTGLDISNKEKTKLIPKLVQKLTGYDPEYMEGYENEEGNYIPGAIELANQTGSELEFKGAASLRDFIRQQQYKKDYAVYQEQLDKRNQDKRLAETLGKMYAKFKKGGAKKKYTSDIINSTNYLFAEHPLFKKKKQSKKRIYNPKASYYQPGGETNCTEDQPCYETDQIQAMYNEGLDLPRKNVGLMWNVADDVNNPESKYYRNAKNKWKDMGLPQTLSQRLGMENPSNCMWAAGSGWQCLSDTKDEFKTMPLSAFESNDKFINAVNKGTIPFERIAKVTEKGFDAKEKGLLKTGDIINLKGPNHLSHAITFSHYREDGTPIYLDSSGHVMDFNWNAGIYKGVEPGNGRVAYVSRFSPEKYYADEIEPLEEKARTNPTYYNPSDIATVNKKSGGSINYKLGDEVDEATMRYLKKLGFTFETIR